MGLLCGRLRRRGCGVRGFVSWGRVRGEGEGGLGEETEVRMMEGLGMCWGCWN